MHHLPFSQLVDHCSAPLLCLDPDGRVTYLNDPAATLLAHRATDLLGRPFPGRLRPDLPTGPPDPTTDLELDLSDAAHPRFCRCRIDRCVGENGATIGYLVAIEDRTEYRRLRDERERLMELATISEVLPAILHEFKNPLAGIQALVELMTEDCADEALQEQLHSILMEIRRMNLGFEGLGFTTRMLRSRRAQAVDYGLREACLIFERRLRARGITLETRIATMPLLPFDTGAIRGVLFNLLNNAQQACGAGAVIRVTACLSDDGTAFVFGVHDTGPGMTPEVLAQCTQLFFTTKRMGSGIGLALCRSAVEKSHGRLEIRSVVGEGTCIDVTLPLSLPKITQGVHHESGRAN